MDKIKLYRNHDTELIDRAVYMGHLSAMTGEDLNGKAEICEELAVRDMHIENLDQAYEGVVTDLSEACADRLYEANRADRLEQENAALKARIAELEGEGES